MISNDITSASSSVFTLRNGAIAEEIATPERYADHDIKSTTSFWYAQFPGRRQSENAILARLSPLDRWKYLARNNKAEFVIWIMALLGGIYVVMSAAIHLGIDVLSRAHAQSASSSSIMSSHDAFDWYVGGLMGVVLLCSLGIVMVAQTESKISFGKDTTKMIIGFVVGFLSGVKPR